MNHDCPLNIESAGRIGPYCIFPSTCSISPGGGTISHIVQIQTQVRDEEAIRSACRRLNLAAPVRGTFPLYGGNVSGLTVQLPEWQYPIVCDPATGSVQYDNFGGIWGDAQELNRFLQAYAVEKAR